MNTLAGAIKFRTVLIPWSQEMDFLIVRSNPALVKGMFFMDIRAVNKNIGGLEKRSALLSLLKEFL